MAHGPTELQELPLRRLETLPRALGLVLAALLLIAGAVFMIGLLGDPARAWRAYLFNWTFWTSIAQGAVIFAAVLIVARGVWSRPLRRIALSFVAFLPVSFLLVIPLFFAGEHIFTWYGQSLYGREVYLNIPFLVIRTSVTLLALLVLSLLFAYWAVRPDAGMLRDTAPDRLRPFYERLSRDWRGQEAEETIAHRKLTRIAPALIIVYAVTYTLLSVDFIMSQEWDWFSTLIGGYYFMGAFLGGVAATALLAVLYRRALDLGAYIDGSRLHDLGKLTFGFCVFWAYLFWSQYIVIWYGQLPWEQIFLVRRLGEPWVGTAVAVFLLLFALPFAGLIGVRPKRNPAILGTIATVILIGVFLERYLLLYPSFYTDVDAIVFGLPELSAALLFGAAFVLALLVFAARLPIMQLWLQPTDLALLEETEERPQEVVTEERGPAED